MNSGINVNDPQVVSAFMSTLLHQGMIAVLIFATIGLTWLTVRAFAQANAIALPGADGASPAGQAEPPDGEAAGRQLLRIGFGILWLFDGILQAQTKMAIGLPSQVIEPTAAPSPHWVQTVVNWAGTNWSYHPLQAGAAAVWIQAGIGVWLLAAPHGRLSRLAGLVSAGWGLVVWVFGESFGAIFAPGLTWLFGAPGAVLIYCVAGGLVALPERAWASPRLGRVVLAGTGLFLVGMAVLQAWPGRGFWQGVTRGQPGSLAAMTQTMTGTSQPKFLESLVTAFTSVDEAHGFAVNLAAVTALAVVGAVFLTGRTRLIRPAVIVFTVLCLADWVLIEDLGFLGGLGTDPNSMIPMILLAAAGYLGLTRIPVPAVEPSEGPAMASGLGAVRWRGLRPANLLSGLAGLSFRSLVTAGAVGLIVLGAAPMAVAQANPNADPILAQTITGATAPLRMQAPAFQLSDQNGRTVSLASLRGKVVLLSFFDPVCTVDCPLIAQEFRQAANLLRGDATKVELVGVVLSPSYRSVRVLRAFDRQEGLSGIPNWRFLTGNLTQLRAVWAHYGMVVQDLPAGSMTLHNDLVFVIDAQGRIRQDINSDPGPGSTATRSSFAVLFAEAVRQALR